MAPIPKDNKEKPANRDGTEIDMFSNPNLAVATAMSDSSDENDEDFENIPSTAGYTLLSQEPGGEDDYDDDVSSDDEMRTNRSVPCDEGRSHVSEDTNNKTQDIDQMIQGLPDGVVQSGGTASGLTVPTSTSSYHPAFLAKFPDGKMPSYMQVPAVPSDFNSKEHLWNQKRQGKHFISMDSGQESKILRAMANVSLPKENVPDWARNLSEDQWKQQVIGKISPEEEQVMGPNETRNNTPGGKPSSQQVTARGKTEAECDWVATFPDS